MKDFFKRRLIRLHPMIVMGAVIGVIAFFVQGGVKWDGTHVATSMVMLTLLLSLFFIPAYPGAGYDIRGNGEMFPLNGPSWSLFFEYIGNLLYALFIRRLGNKALTVLVVLLGLGLAGFALFDVVGYGMLGVGWTLDGQNFLGGLLRMLFPFTLGMLISRNFRPFQIRGAFWICAIVLLVLFCVPYIEGKSPVCLNGVFEMICIAVIFPFWYASVLPQDNRQAVHPHLQIPRRYLLSALCRTLPDHVCILFLADRDQTIYPRRNLAVAAAVYFGSILTAWLCLKLYDEPVRKWLNRRFMKKRSL